MAGAYIYYALLTTLGFPFPVAFAATLLAAGVIGALIERLIMHRLVGEPEFVLLMVTAGLAVVIRAGVGMTFSHDTLTVLTPLSGRSFTLGGATITAAEGWACLVTLVLTAVLFAFFRMTRLGIAMRAVAQNRHAAQLMGISVRRIFTFTWALAAIAAAVGGILLADITPIHTNMGLIGLNAAPAAVLGGLTSIPGALAGGLIIGLVEHLIGVSLGSGLKEVSAYVVLLAVLLLRPAGLFGTAETKRV